MSAQTPVAVITGASSGFGAAAARALVGAGFDVVLGARRGDRLAALAGELARERQGAARWRELDVTSDTSVAAFADSIDSLELLLNNAGNAFGSESVEHADETNWRAMFELNVLGVLRVTRALLPKLSGAGEGRAATIVNVGSIAGFEVYPGGAGYTASKHALRALTRTLRLELLGRPIRVSEIAPGLAETEFALVRHGGDREKAKRVYEGMTPLTAADVAAAVVWIATRPAHVNVDEIVIRPRDQATATLVHRRSPE